MLVNCVAYRDGRRLGEISLDQISEYLKDRSIFVWVAFKDPDVHEILKMKEEFSLHDLAVEDAIHGFQRPKLEEYGDRLFVALSTMETDAQGELQSGEVSIFMGPNYVLSIRKRSEQGFANVRERCEKESHLLKHGSVFVLYALMDTVVDRYFPVIQHLQAELEKVEEHIFSNGANHRKNIEEIYSLKRKVLVLQHANSSMLEATGKLHGGRVPPSCVNMQEYFRDVSDHIIRITKEIDELREMIATAVQVSLGMISLNESEVTKKLASYGALFAAPTAIAGVYGMNFKNMPELDWPWGYPVVLSIMVVVNILLWWRFKTYRWL